MVFVRPQRLEALCGFWSPPALVVGAAVVAVAAWFAWRAPFEAAQGEAARLMFVHVPAAWWALASYMALAGMSGCALITRAPIWDATARALAPLTAILAGLTLATGALWGRATWGVWWLWDARLASMTALFAIVLGYLALWHTRGRPRRAAFMARVWALVGVADLALVKYSVELRRTLHQPASVLREGGPAMDAAFLAPLGLMALGWGLLLAGLWARLVRAELMWARVRARARAALGAPWVASAPQEASG